MAQQTINVGAAANDGTGDTARDGGVKINANFGELYAADTALAADIAGKAASAHTHAIGDTTGLQAAIDGKQPLAAVLTGTTASFTTAQETKLSGIATGATVNAADATLLARANHTGTQAVGTITGLATVATSGSAADLIGTLAADRLGSGAAMQVVRRNAGNTALEFATLAGGSDPWTVVKLGSNVAVSTTALADVTGLSFTASTSTWYEVECFGAYQAAATTTGVALALKIPSGTVIAQTLTSVSATAAGTSEQIADDAVTGATTGTRAANTNAPIRFKALVNVGVTGGTVQLRMRSEIAASAVTLQGGLFFMRYRAL